MKKKKPKILLCKDLTLGFKKAVNEYDEILKDTDQMDKSFQIKSTFVYVFAIFEFAFTNCLTYFLTCFPEKLDISKIDFKKNKNAIVNESLICELIDSVIEDYVMQLSYGNLQDYFQTFCEILSISYKDGELIDDLKEKKATRNLLLHNDLVVNKRYLETAGNKVRASEPETKLNITKEYLISTIELLKQILTDINLCLVDKYEIYTKEKILRDIWNYLFDSPIMRFDDYWIAENGRIITFNIEMAEKYMKCLSSYEKTMLIMWLQNFSSSICDEFYKFNDMRMWIGMTEEIAFLSQVLSKYPHLLQG